MVRRGVGGAEGVNCTRWCEMVHSRGVVHDGARRFVVV